MNTSAIDWVASLRRYLAASLALHLLWETVQLPLYTIWTTEPFSKQVFAVVHCTIGDAMIAALSLMIAIAAVGHPGWPRTSARPVWMVMVLLGIAYTVYSEWLNVNVRGSWAYSPAMPTLPVLGTGLAPLLQWIVVPMLAQRIAIGHRT